MVEIKIGTFPGELKSYGVKAGTSVKDALTMAGITIGAEQEVKLDGDTVSLDSTIGAGSNLLLVTKRLKGAR
jgi:hypothetical protein